VPGGPHETAQRQGPPPTQGQELGEQVAPDPDLFREGERERQYADLYEEVEDGVDDAALRHDERGKRGCPYDG
jgi:hypothetical protein